MRSCGSALDNSWYIAGRTWTTFLFLSYVFFVFAMVSIAVGTM